MSKEPLNLDQNLSPVFARAERVRPRVQQPDSPWTVPLGVVGAIAIGVMVFGGLSNARSARAQPQPAPPPAPAPAQVQAPTVQIVAPPQPVNPPLQPNAPPPPPIFQQDPLEAHYRSPTLVVDLASQSGQAAQAAAGVAPGAVAAAAVGAVSRDDARGAADERFAARVAGSTAETVRAYQMRDLTRMVPQGAVIPAVLETAIDSDLPGGVRGIVSRDVRSFDGAQVLIPRGSKLIGQYKSAVAVGQTRAFVVWSRMITPSGVSIDIGSPAADRLGRGGLPGDVDTHFLERFGAAILLSVITTGLQAAAQGGNDGGNNSLIIASPTQANRVAEIALQRQIDIPVTIRVPQGTPVQVFVSRDLDFSAVSFR